MPFNDNEVHFHKYAHFSVLPRFVKTIFQLKIHVIWFLLRLILIKTKKIASSEDYLILQLHSKKIRKTIGEKLMDCE